MQWKDRKKKEKRGHDIERERTDEVRKGKVRKAKKTGRKRKERKG